MDSSTLPTQARIHLDNEPTLWLTDTLGATITSTTTTSHTELTKPYTIPPFTHALNHKQHHIMPSYNMCIDSLWMWRIWPRFVACFLHTSNSILNGCHKSNRPTTPTRSCFSPPVSRLKLGPNLFIHAYSTSVFYFTCAVTFIKRILRNANYIVLYWHWTQTQYTVFRQ